ncbi:MAG TPA: dihydroneopterin aldolase [Elusimicrobiota bacterium]|jgi:dihydroneopterin aldolase|nr:dihydroneopterin aldolase [Elusimicrobiota bacterium]
MVPDRVWLLDVACRCRVGVPAAERARRQRILLDLGLEVDAARAAARDDFREAADYHAVEKAARAEAEAGERALLETLAERVAAAVLRAQPRVSAVTVRARKFPAVMPKTREVAVEIRRGRA